jgi:general secretion pathway protein B
MSFILDAIAKSEQERQQQEVPGARVLALPAGGVQKPRRVMPYFIIGALLLNAALFVVWMKSSQSLLDLSSPTQTENIDRGNQQAIVSGDITPVDAPISVEIPDNTTEMAVEIDTTASMNELLAEQPGTTPAGTSETDAGLANGPELLQSGSFATTTGGDTTAWERIEPDTLSNKARSGKNTGSVQDLQNTGVTQRKVSSLSELPSDVRRDLPRVIFTGHLYSSDPNSSVVFIDNGRPVMKGRQIANELFLYEITPTGVIVEFRGYLIDVGVLQNWTLN